MTFYYVCMYVDKILFASVKFDENDDVQSFVDNCCSFSRTIEYVKHRVEDEENTNTYCMYTDFGTTEQITVCAVVSKCVSDHQKLLKTRILFKHLETICKNKVNNGSQTEILSQMKQLLKRNNDGQLCDTYVCRRKECRNLISDLHRDLRKKEALLSFNNDEQTNSIFSFIKLKEKIELIKEKIFLGNKESIREIKFKIQSLESELREHEKNNYKCNAQEFLNKRELFCCCAVCSSSRSCDYC